MSTNFIAKLNKGEAAFHLLGLLSLADGVSDTNEQEVIMEFLDNNYDDGIDLIKEQAFLKALPATEYLIHFEEVCNRFYSLSDADERNRIIEFAMKVVMADKKMTEGENKLIDKLFTSWDLNRSN